MKKLLSFSVFLLTASSYCLSQTSDPLTKHKKFFELGLHGSLTRVNTNFTDFTTANGEYKFDKNKYIPSFDASFNYGSILSLPKIDGVWLYKIGANLVSKKADVMNVTEAKNYRLSTQYIQIPVQLGFRKPISYASSNSKFYKSIDFSAGLFISLPVSQRLTDKNDIDSKYKTLKSEYLKYGFIGDITFSALDDKGHGHKFGIRVSQEFNRFSKFKDTQYQLYPFYTTIGIFYNILNKCSK
jgi:hypothetical protein